MWPFDRNKKFIQSLGKGHSYTPDMTVLEQGPYQLVFLCDDMKRAHNKHGLIEEQSFPTRRSSDLHVRQVRLPCRQRHRQSVAFCGQGWSACEG